MNTDRNKKKDIADKLYNLMHKRFEKEQPEHKLTLNEINNIWFTIYGKLYRGETESEVKEWCQMITLSKLCEKLCR